MARVGFTRHPKFRRLVAMLQIPEAHARGHCEMLWEVAYEAGDDRIGDSIDVELAAGWAGSQGELTKALLGCGGLRAGLIEEIPGEQGAYRIHDLFDHAPDYVQKRRKREADRRTRGEELRTLSAERRTESTERQTTADNGEACPPNGRTLTPTLAPTLAPTPTPTPKGREEKDPPTPQAGGDAGAVAPGCPPARLELVRGDPRAGKLRKPCEAFSEDFLAFWARYPRRVAKAAAWHAWRRAGPPVERLHAALDWQIELEDWAKDGGRFVPHPATYLNQRRWEDERPARASPNAGRCEPKGYQGLRDLACELQAEGRLP